MILSIESPNKLPTKVMKFNELPLTVKSRICTCPPTGSIYGPYPEYDVIRKVCKVCFKPRIERAFQCVDCEAYFVRSGDTDFRHPQFCVFVPRCWTCVNKVPIDRPMKECCEYCRINLREIPLQREQEQTVKPPKRIEGVLDEDFDIFA